MGDMLEESWEQWACRLANASNLDSVVQELIQYCNIDLNASAKVVIGRDTRPSGIPLTQSLIHGLDVFQARVTDLGLVTTPQLHYITRCFNDPSFGEPTINGYTTKLANAFNKCMTSMSPMNVVVDCANGVGAIALQELSSRLTPSLKLTLTHTQMDQPAVLNAQCGADFVKTQQRAPDPLVPFTLYASLDGDADRIVFYYHNGTQFRLLDGDKIACLYATYFQKLYPDKVGVVQTAYANGSSTHYLSQLKVPVICTTTGVKHLHAEAHAFPIGVYFEANGHGTVLFQSSMAMGSLSDLINPTVGDALSDFLFTLVVLNELKWNVQQWDQLYQDAPNGLWKVKVKDRSIFTTTNADRQLLTPPSLQTYIDQAMAKVKGRAFVRPSGTEAVVRVYAEAPTEEACQWLGNVVAGGVFDLGGGTGERPSSFLKLEGF